MNLRKFLLPLCLATGIATAAASHCSAQTYAGNEYAIIGYDTQTPDNPVEQLAARLKSGEAKLTFEGKRGYLDSLLGALNIDPASQTLVFSKTSLQYPKINAEKPRALYFSEDVYIGWVQDSNIIEVMAIDSAIGMMFYVFHNTRDIPQPLEKSAQRCLVCHDSNGAMGGGTPLLLAQSTLYDLDYDKLHAFSERVTDTTPVAERWGGWYVSGQSGSQTHLGNIRLQGPAQLTQLDKLTRTNVNTLAELEGFDPAPYLRATSDIVALMVLEHQLTVQNQLTYVKFKLPAVLARAGLSDAVQSATWAALPERAQRTLPHMLDNLVKLLLMQGAAEFSDRISGDPAFQAGFEAQGPRDASGRSLRELDLETRLFKYPLSYLVYSKAFDSLPTFARDYIYRQLAAILQGHDKSKTYAYLSRSERRTVLEILSATKPEFAAYLDTTAKP